MNKYPEYQAYKKLSYWQPLHKNVPLNTIIPRNNEYYPILKFYYKKVMKLYETLPLRKNGEQTFLHPLNIMHFLQKGSVENQKVDEITLLVGLLHDYLEEIIELYQKREGLHNTDKKLLDYQNKVFNSFQAELYEFCRENNYSPTVATQVMDVLILVTKRVEDTYYIYVSRIFNSKNKIAQERAILVKLSDRIHNILCIECFNKRERIYQCFKNLFILNNVKKYLLKRYTYKMWNGKINNLTEMFFNKCIKATHDAFFTITHDSVVPKYNLSSMLQMAFKKFSVLDSGLEIVPLLKNEELHLVRLYQGIIRKYDYLLHHEIDEFKDAVENERDYCQHFFINYKLTNKEIHKIIDYKDAYYLKEYLARLLYKPKYYMSGFISSELLKNRII
ncbi:MAG: hypothetical protein ABIC91_05415 [Nanoarchaeota archaeon]